MTHCLSNVYLNDCSYKSFNVQMVLTPEENNQNAKEDALEEALRGYVIPVYFVLGYVLFAFFS